MDKFEQQVAEALAAIPHGAQCPAQPQEYPVDVAEMVTVTVTMGICDCDREQRIASGVTRMLMASFWAGWDALAGQLPEDAVNLEGANRHGNRYGGASGDGVLAGVRVLGGGQA